MNLNQNNIYSILGDYIQQEFFHNSNRGEEIFPIIDSYLIKQFCSQKSISIRTFNKLLLESNIWSVTSKSPMNVIIGFIGIQLYAASKMENLATFTYNNFRNRICHQDILNIDVKNWQEWVRLFQDDIWSKYYNWCQDNSFIITNKCLPKAGKDRYVQYPKIHSKQIFNREDLKQIANIFVDKGLKAGEDISKEDFWRLIGNDIYISDYVTNRAYEIFIQNDSQAREQIYHYFLIWDGEYNYNDNKRTVNSQNYNLHLMCKQSRWQIEICTNSSNKRVKQIDLTSSKCINNLLNGYYTFRRLGIILFQKSQYYDEYWDEVPFLDESTNGNFAIFTEEAVRRYRSKYMTKDIVAQFASSILIKIEGTHYKDFYASPRPYSLTGGIKLKANRFLYGAPPILELKEELNVWIDDKLSDINIGIITFNFKEGKHHIKIKGFKIIDIDIMKITPLVKTWNTDTKWMLSKRERLWQPQQNKGESIIGLDFESISLLQQTKELTKWCEQIFFKKKNNSFNKLKNIK